VPILAKVAVAMALLAAFLNAVFNLCLGCELFLLWKRFSSRSATAAPDDPQDASQDEEASRDEEVPAAEVEDDEQAASPDHAEADAANQ
jgi:hypothetical protein